MRNLADGNLESDAYRWSKNSYYMWYFISINAYSIDFRMWAKRFTFIENLEQKLHVGSLWFPIASTSHGMRKSIPALGFPSCSVFLCCKAPIAVLAFNLKIKQATM